MPEGTSQPWQVHNLAKEHKPEREYSWRLREVPLPKCLGATKVTTLTSSLMAHVLWTVAISALITLAVRTTGSSFLRAFLVYVSLSAL